MELASFFVALAGVGVTAGWQPLPDDQSRYEYIVQLEPDVARLLAEGNSIPIAVEPPSEIQPIARIRIVVGEGIPPRRRLATAMKPIVDRLDGQRRQDFADEGVQLTQFTIPNGNPTAAGQFSNGPAAVGANSPAQPNAGRSIAQTPGYAQGPQQTGAGTSNPYAQQMAQQLNQWAQGQTEQLRNQVQGAVDETARNTQQAIDDSVRGVQSSIQPGVQQLFGSNQATAGVGSQGASSTAAPWTRTNPTTAAAAGSNAQNDPGAAQRAGQTIQQALEPLGRGLNQLDDGIRDAAGNLSNQARQLFDNLGRPIPRLASGNSSPAGGGASPSAAATVAPGAAAQRTGAPGALAGRTAPANQARGNVPPWNQRGAAGNLAGNASPAGPGQTAPGYRNATGQSKAGAQPAQSQRGRRIDQPYQPMAGQYDRAYGAEAQGQVANDLRARSRAVEDSNWASPRNRQVGQSVGQPGAQWPDSNRVAADQSGLDTLGSRFPATDQHSRRGANQQQAAGQPYGNIRGLNDQRYGNSQTTGPASIGVNQQDSYGRNRGRADPRYAADLRANPSHSGAVDRPWPAVEAGMGNVPKSESAWPDSGPRFPKQSAEFASETVIPSIDKRMLAHDADDPVAEVRADQLVFGGDLPPPPAGEKPPFNAPVNLASDDGRPTAAALGWDLAHNAKRPYAQQETPQEEAGVATQANSDGTRLGLLAAWLILSGSVAGNVYLFWSYLDVRNKYSSLVRKTARAVGGRFAATAA